MDYRRREQAQASAKLSQETLEKAAKEDRELGKHFIGPVGDQVFKRLRLMFYDRPSFVQGDPYYTAFKEGQRDVIGFISQCREAATDEL